jgi:vacuolar-type H+-ATPase subunit I/STV1
MPLEETPIEKNKHEVMESTEEESDVIERYVDIKAEVFRVDMTKEERSDFAQKIIDVVKILNESKNIDSSFREEMLQQIKVVEEQYLAFRKVVELVKQLERESRGGILVPNLYEQAVVAGKKAIEAGVPADNLNSLRETLNKYLATVRKLPTGQK